MQRKLWLVLSLLMLLVNRLSLGEDSGHSSLPGALVFRDGTRPEPEVISRDGEGRITVRGIRLSEPLEVDGNLEESVYRTIPAIGGFIQQEPHGGEPATEPTEVWIFFDETHVYVAARCWDSHPERRVANEMRRDNFNMSMNDNFAVVFDTFNDRRNGFLFYTNPLGGLYDAQVTDESNTNSDWNTVWQVKTGRFRQGWDGGDGVSLQVAPL